MAMSRIAGRRRTSHREPPAHPADELAAVLARHHRFHAVRGHLHEMAGDRDSAAREYRTAAACATNIPEKRYLERKLAALRPGRQASSS
jgi:predicted RNA polymerase sigma factor